MAEGNGTNGSGGNGAGETGAKRSPVATLVEGAKAVQAQAVEEIKALKQPEKTDVWK